MDLGFILDESGSISTSQFRKETDFVRMLTTPFLIGVDNTRVSIITYSSNVRFHFQFRDYQGYDKTGLHNALGSLYRKGTFAFYVFLFLIRKISKAHFFKIVAEIMV